MKRRLQSTPKRLFWLIIAFSMVVVPVLLVNQTVFAQTAMRVVGQVHLEGQYTHAGAVVSSQETQMMTDETGHFALIIIPSQAETLTVKRQGYLSLQVEGLLPDADGELQLEPMMLLAGELTGDDKIDIFDLAVISSAYGKYEPKADLNQDQLVDIFDVMLCAKNYGQRGPIVVAAPPLGSPLTLDQRLRAAIQAADIKPIEPAPAANPNLIHLGRMLFFDKELSGTRDVACATCHHPAFSTSDGIPVSKGVGGEGLGPDRILPPERNIHPRHSPDLFNRGAPEFTTLFWDSRISGTLDTGFTTPAGILLPDGLDNIVAALAMFPVTARDEMRGMPRDLDVHGQFNELAAIPDTNFPAMWDGLMARLMAIPEYQALFQAAHPDIDQGTHEFQHAANAMAAFIIDAFTFTNSPWDRYVAGDNRALSREAKQGGLLFFGEVGCAECHAGTIFTDLAHHNIGMPQIGPGQAAEKPQDFGRYRETYNRTDLYAFRTPPLRNVALTAPYGHDGAYSTLEGIVRHHLNPTYALRHYDVAQLPADLQDTFLSDEATLSAILSTLDPRLAEPKLLSEAEIMQLLAFLNALTDPAAINLNPLTPATVPSGLPVDQP